MASVDLIQTQEQFLKELEHQGKSLNTLKNYRADLHVFNKFLALHKRPMQMKGMTLAQVQEYTNHLQETYGSSNSIRRRVQALRLFFDFLVSRHSFPNNPIKLIPVAPKVLDMPNPTPFKDLVRLKETLEERIKNSQGLDQLLARRNLLVMALIYEAGLKVSDLARLELSDLWEEKRAGTMRVMVRPLKRDPYSIPLNTHFKKVLIPYLEGLKALWHHSEEPKFLLFNANPHRILAGSLSPRGTELMFEEIRHNYKIEITARSLRQAAVFRWMFHKVSEGQIKEWLGVAPDYDISLYLKAFESLQEKPPFLDLIYA